MKLLLLASILLLTVINCRADEHEIDAAQICVNGVEFQYNYDGKLTIPSKEYEAMINECFDENKDN